MNRRWKPLQVVQKKKMQFVITLKGNLLQNVGKLSLKLFSFTSFKGTLFYDKRL